MKKLMVRLATFFYSEKGQGMVEYGLIIGLIAVVLIGALTLISGGLESIFGDIETALTTRGAGGGGAGT